MSQYYYGNKLALCHPLCHNCVFVSCIVKQRKQKVFSKFQGVWLSHQGFSVRVGLLIHDDFGHFEMSAVSGHVKCRQVIIGDIIHGSIVLKEQLDTVQVITLGRHVQRRQTVL